MKQADKRVLAALGVVCGLVALILPREPLAEEERFARHQRQAAARYERRKPT